MVKMSYSLQNGFVLVMTLWILAMLTLAVSFFALWTQRTVSLAQSMQDDLQGEMDMLGTQANVIYLLNSQRMTIAGLTLPLPVNSKNQVEFKRNFIDQDSILPVGGELFLDDRPYVGYGKAFFALQDVRGLIPINFTSIPTLDRLLGLLGVKVDLRSPLIDKLHDYIDIDDLHRLNGAESYHYDKRNLAPPTNHFLRHPMESQHIFDWAEQTGLWENYRFSQLTNTVLSSKPNFNTAPSLVLQASYNLTAKMAEQLIEFRQSQSLYLLGTVNQVMGVHLDIDPDDANFFPANYLRLTLWYEGSPRMQQVLVRLTPANKLKPWKIKSRLDIKLLPHYIESSSSNVQTTIFTTTLSTAAQ